MEKLNILPRMDLTLSPGGRLYLEAHLDVSPENLVSAVVTEKICILFADNVAHGLLHLGFGFFNETLPPGCRFLAAIFPVPAQCRLPTNARR